MPLASALRRSLFVTAEFALCLSLSCRLLEPSWAQQPPGQPAATDSASPKRKPQTTTAKPSDTRPSEPPPVLVQLNSALQGLVARVSPAVVQVLVTAYGPLNENNRAETALIVRQHAVGSGVIVDPEGYIMTNAHVVEGAQRIRVALPLSMEDSPLNTPAGKRHILDAKLLGVHKDSDLALLKVDATNLPTLSLGTGRRARVGQLVFAIGSPEGLQNSVTMGVVSAVGRQPDPDKPMVYLQTDAPINPGNSGGPLLNARGEVIGINTQKLVKKNVTGIGFALSAGDLLEVLHRFYPLTTATAPQPPAPPPLAQQPVQTSDAEKLAAPATADGPGAPSSPPPSPSGSGTVVLTEPEGAEIWIDQEFVGSVPATLKLTAGKHVIVLKMRGHPDCTRTLNLLKASKVSLGPCASP
jgi:S1-C subfamily serine protease